MLDDVVAFLFSLFGALSLIWSTNQKAAFGPLSRPLASFKLSNQSSGGCLVFELLVVCVCCMLI